MRNVAILIFDDVEVLDFCGPYEVFSVTGELNESVGLRVFTVAERALPIQARNGLSVNPRYAFKDSPQPDIIIVPGGQGTRKEMNNPAILSWIVEHSPGAELILSVCTGALILAKAGLLDDLAATTHHGAMELLRNVAPKTLVRPEMRYIDNGRIIVSAGISAGIDMSLYAIGKLFGVQAAEKTALYMEYDWRRQA